MNFRNLLPWRRRQLEQDLDRELHYHLDRRAEELRKGGVTEDEARRLASLEFGNLASVQEDVREAWIRRWVSRIRQDARFALRGLMRSPSFTLASVATLALAIGACTAIFSVVQGILLRPLPYRDPHELVMVWQDMRQRGGPVDEWATPGNFTDWRAESRIFASMASIRGFAPSLTGLGDATMLVGEQVSQSYFDVLGVKAERGRNFLPEEAVPNAPRVVAISHRFWQERLGAAEDVLERQLMLAGEPHRIVGVMPADFRPVINSNADVWRPERLNLVTPNRGAIVLRIVARLQPSVTLEDARAQMTPVAARLARQFPETNANTGVSIVTLHEQVVGNVKPGLFVLLGAVLLTLLIACVNIANLLLARASNRVREMAVRVALGAARSRVIGQLLTESVVLAVLGGAAGLVASYWVLEALVAMAPAATPRLAEISLNGTVLAIAAAMTVATGLVFGMVPALQLARTDHTPALRDGGRGSTGTAGHKLRRALVVAEMAIALMLLVGAGLLTRSFAGMQRADLGFRPEGVVSAFLQVPGNRFQSPDEWIAFEDRVLDRLRTLPGVNRVAWTSILPLAPGGDNDMDFTIEGVPPPRPDQPGTVAWFRVVSADYIGLMGMRVTHGRSFEGREPEPVIVISETLATRYWPGVDPIGRRVHFGEPGRPWFTVIGIVEDVKQQGARSAPRGQMFIPYWHAGRMAAGGMNLVFQTAASAELLRPALVDAVREMDAQLPVTNVAAMTSLIARSVDEPRFLATIAGTFGILSMLLAAVGIYGVTASSVASRRQEISIRLALGASRGDVFGLLYRNGAVLVGAGLLLGAAGAAALAPAMRAILFGLEPVDPMTFAGTAALLAAAAGMAVLLPALRASREEPGSVLRG